MRHTCIQLSINVVDDIGDIPLRRADSEINKVQTYASRSDGPKCSVLFFSACCGAFFGILCLRECRLRELNVCDRVFGGMITRQRESRHNAQNVRVGLKALSHESSQQSSPSCCQRRSKGSLPFPPASSGGGKKTRKRAAALELDHCGNAVPYTKMHTIEVSSTPRGHSGCVTGLCSSRAIQHKDRDKAPSVCACVCVCVCGLQEMKESRGRYPNVVVQVPVHRRALPRARARGRGLAVVS